MGTRGALGWITREGEVKANYQQYDSYPRGVGRQLQEALKPLNRLPEIPEGMRWVPADGKPTREELAAFKDAELWQEVSEGDDWYAALRGLQGRLDLMLEHRISTDHGSEFIKDGLFCEWAYLIDLRSDEVVILKGGVNTEEEQAPYARTDEPHRTGNADDDVYWGCMEIWRGSREAFLELDMEKFEDAVYAANDRTRPWGEQVAELMAATGAPMGVLASRKA
jgi:hypothetical protein